MDAAVSLVQAYLRVNGFFTVAEYPVLARLPDGHFKEATDLDLLAVRLPGAGRVLPRSSSRGRKLDVDAVLDVDWQKTELVVAEVKEGVADVNRALLRADTLREALRRFGVVPRDMLHDAVRDLHVRGQTHWDGHRARLFAFGTRPPEHAWPGTFVGLDQVVWFLEHFVAHSRRIGAHRFRDEALGLLSLRAKAMGTSQGAREPARGVPKPSNRRGG